MRARPGFGPGTSRTLSENHTPSPTSQCKPGRQHPLLPIIICSYCARHASLSPKSTDSDSYWYTEDWWKTNQWWLDFELKEKNKIIMKYNFWWTLACHKAWPTQPAWGELEACVLLRNCGTWFSSTSKPWYRAEVLVRTNNCSIMAYINRQGRVQSVEASKGPMVVGLRVPVVPEGSPHPRPTSCQEAVSCQMSGGSPPHGVGADLCLVPGSVKWRWICSPLDATPTVLGWSTLGGKRVHSCALVEETVYASFHPFFLEESEVGPVVGHSGGPGSPFSNVVRRDDSDVLWTSLGQFGMLCPRKWGW